MTAALRILASPTVTWAPLGILIILGVFGAGTVTGQMLERERPVCGWPR